MKKWIKKFESVFVSVAFAEMGEHNVVIKMLGMQPKDFSTVWDDVFTAVTFAEAG
ncbi:MAG TPA: hypothetical protein VMW06_11270 [Desulfobacterales bacterium]|nr:hypothetical protein [Desulfobacterales bacterium]